jgi:hypothetical protein
LDRGYPIFLLSLSPFGEVPDIGVGVCEEVFDPRAFCFSDGDAECFVLSSSFFTMCSLHVFDGDFAVVIPPRETVKSCAVFGVEYVIADLTDVC